MDTQTGVIRAIPELEQAKPDEIEITAVERKVLEGYQERYRPELLRRWRAGWLDMRITGDGPVLVDVATKSQRHTRTMVAGFKSKKARRRIAARSRSRNRR